MGLVYHSQSFAVRSTISEVSKYFCPWQILLLPKLGDGGAINFLFKYSKQDLQVGTWSRGPNMSQLL